MLSQLKSKEEITLNRLPSVITVEDAAKRLLATPEAVTMELESGRLKGFTIASEWRTTEESLIAFIEEPVKQEVKGASPLSASRSAESRSDMDQLDSILSGIVWESEGPFDHHWPKRKEQEENIEHYDESYISEIIVGNRDLRIKIGFGNRFTAGKVRRRAVVFLDDGRRIWPVVEFVGADDFEESGKMISLIKIPKESGKGHIRLHPGDQPSLEYASMPVVEYNAEVMGRYAATGLAVLVRKGECTLMARHAMIRARQKGWI